MDGFDRFDSFVVLAHEAADEDRDRAALAGRAARELPAILVEPARDVSAPRIEAFGADRRLLVPLEMDADTITKTTACLAASGVRRPLLWLENPRLAKLFARTFAPLKIARIDVATDANESLALRHADRVVTAAAPRAGVLALGARFGTEADRAVLAAAPERGTDRLNVIVFYDPHSVFTSTVTEHLASLQRFSVNTVMYAPGTRFAPCEFDLADFDVVIVHYTVRLSLPDHISPPVAEAIARHRGFKALFIQDEYDATETARRWIERLGIQFVFTTVPPESIDRVYPSARFAAVEFLTNFTGYAPPPSMQPVKPLALRRYVLGYRGRELAYWYGHLAREKMIIGQRMRELCDARGLVTNIEWHDSHRIYGPAWGEFLQDCRATLGTESGANLFDDEGLIRKAIEAARRENPGLDYAEAHRRFMAGRDGEVRMNQVSPKIFEAISYRTALVLFEGEYSGVVAPDRHYIPLKKDFSNVDEVLAKVADDRYLEALTERAYREIIESGRFSYAEFVRRVDDVFARNVRRSGGTQWASGVVALRRPPDETWREQAGGHVLSEPLDDAVLRRYHRLDSPRTRAWDLDSIVERIRAHPFVFRTLRSAWRCMPLVIRAGLYRWSYYAFRQVAALLRRLRPDPRRNAS